MMNEVNINLRGKTTLHVRFFVFFPFTGVNVKVGWKCSCLHSVISPELHK